MQVTTDADSHDTISRKEVEKPQNIKT